MKSETATVWLLLVVCTFFWGSNFNAAHFIADEVEPLTAAAERFGLAMLVLLAMRFWRGRGESRLTPRTILVLVLLGWVGVFGFNYAFFYALHSTSALNGALIMALSPMVTALLSALVLGTALSVQQVAGILVAFGGVVLVITGGEFSHLQMADGDRWMLLGCFLWSAYSVLMKWGAASVPSMQQARWTISSGALLLVAMALWRENPLHDLGQQTPGASLVLLYMSLCGTVLAYIFWLKGVDVLGPQRAALGFNLVPVFALLVNLVLGIWPLWTQWLGLVLVCAGVLVGSTDRQRNPLRQ